MKAVTPSLFINAASLTYLIIKLPTYILISKGTILKVYFVKIFSVYAFDSLLVIGHVILQNFMESLGMIWYHEMQEFMP